MNDDCKIIRTLSSSVVRQGSYVIKSIPATSNALKEISILRSIEHDQIIKLIDFHLDTEIKLIMPLVFKVPLSLPIDIFYTQCLKILTVLENINIVHLDFREENLGYDGNKIILLDFGNAVILRKNTLISYTNYPPEYIRAPEINSLYISRIDSRVDLWSLGAIVYNRIHNYYPTLYNMNELENNKLHNDLKSILTINRPYASELALKWNINIKEGRVNLPNRMAKSINGSYLLKYHIERALSIEPNLDTVLKLYTDDNVLTTEDLNLFKKLDCQLFSE